MPRDLILEIGTEEIPAGFLSGVLPVLRERVSALMEETRLEHGEIRVLGAPRRLTALISRVAERQASVEERVFGPPAQVAFDSEGQPTKAAIGFAKRNGVDVGELGTLSAGGQEGRVCRLRSPRGGPGFDGGFAGKDTAAH